ncbi:hypothetical protein [Niveispirillum sp.]|uniref:hypothetical protein n=1 Tax=Niveispirillum sp. TaxID=1917217 RepID=UPI001B5ADA07|nr:hypothetical protein [Niveispirillum sp.]MBP7335084.1 hypothetical protein [Niveispirillum sp.]
MITVAGVGYIILLFLLSSLLPRPEAGWAVMLRDAALNLLLAFGLGMVQWRANSRHRDAIALGTGVALSLFWMVGSLPLQQPATMVKLTLPDAPIASHGGIPDDQPLYPFAMMLTTVAGLVATWRWRRIS